MEKCGLGHDTERICCSCAAKVAGEIDRLRAVVHAQHTELLILRAREARVRNLLEQRQRGVWPLRSIDEIQRALDGTR